jgi:hypothetical protein
MAEAVAEAGASVVMIDVDREGIFSTCEELRREGYSVFPMLENYFVDNERLASRLIHPLVERDSLLRAA